MRSVVTKMIYSNDNESQEFVSIDAAKTIVQHNVDLIMEGSLDS